MPKVATARDHPKRIIALINQKGGVGKSNVTLNLAGILGSLGFKVVVVDLDPQATTTHGMIGRPKEARPGIAELLLAELGRLTGEGVQHEVALMQAMVPVEAYGVMLIPAAGPALRKIAKVMDVEAGSEKLLERVLANVQADFVLIDCPPALGILNTNAMLAATGLVIPIAMEDEAIDGFADFLQAIDRIRRATDREIPIDYIVPTMYVAREKLSKDTLATLTHFYKDAVHAPIHKRVELKRVFKQKKPVHILKPTSQGTDDYTALARSIINANQ